MQPAKSRARACQQSTEDHPQNEQRMQEEDGNSECKIQPRGTNGCRHLWNLQQRRLTIGLIHIPCARGAGIVCCQKIVRRRAESLAAVEVMEGIIRPLKRKRMLSHGNAPRHWRRCCQKIVRRRAESLADVDVMEGILDPLKRKRRLSHENAPRHWRILQTRLPRSTTATMWW